MGTKSLNGAVHQFLLQNQHFPPVLTAGECQTNMKKQSGVAISGMAKYVHMVLSPLDMEVISSFQDEMFIAYFCANYYGTFGNWAKGCRTIVTSLAGLMAGLGTSSSIPGGSESFPLC
eukprot:15333798-Ditylum_brightwellii.AAC.1